MSVTMTMTGSHDSHWLVTWLLIGQYHGSLAVIVVAICPERRPHDVVCELSHLTADLQRFGRQKDVVEQRVRVTAVKIHWQSRPCLGVCVSGRANAPVARTRNRQAPRRVVNHSNTRHAARPNTKVSEWQPVRTVSTSTSPNCHSGIGIGIGIGIAAGRASCAGGSIGIDDCIVARFERRFDR